MSHDDPFDEPKFDFAGHGDKAQAAYEPIRATYERFAKKVEADLKEAMETKQISFASTYSRAKTLSSFRLKAMKPKKDNPNAPKYPEPLIHIEDMAGVRIVVYLLETISTIDSLINEMFIVHYRSDKSEVLIEQERFGYQSLHYIASLPPERAQWANYQVYAGLKAEIQVRTLLQHAWAEIEHDIQYKSVTAIPPTTRRRFMSLAGILEIADREFQTIQDEDMRNAAQSLESIEEARQSVITGEPAEKLSEKLNQVGITPDTLKAYLDGRMTPDRRMTPDNYDWAARLVLRLEFTTIGEIDDCTREYDPREVSHIAWNTLPGQLVRFETLLLAGMGRAFIDGHFAAHNSDWYEKWESALGRLLSSNIQVGNYKPSQTGLERSEL